MTAVKHKFINHEINPLTETLIIGTFNPAANDNKANFFYSRSRNYLWKIIPYIFGDADLKGKSEIDKLAFIQKRKIDFIDLISEISVENATNYYDGYLDKNNPVWRDIICEIKKLQHIKRVCFTRRSFSDVPNMKRKIDEIEKFCTTNNIYFQNLITPARFYSEEKQNEWTKFFERNSLP